MTYSAVEYLPGEIVFRQGEEGDCMYLVQEGEVEVMEDLDGAAPKLVATLERGDFFGEMAILEKEPRTHAVRAKSNPTKLVKVDSRGFSQMLGRNPEIGVRMIRKLARRQHATEERLIRVLEGTQEDLDATQGARVKIGRFIHLSDDVELRLPLGDEITIGRRDPMTGIDPDLDLTPFDPKLSTSRRHARLQRKDGKHLLIEEKATNGTWVNDRRLTANQPLALENGDRVSFGAVHMRFELG